MGDHPEFPQESPAMKYLIEQVSKIEDAQACGVGYYKSLHKVLERLDKTDILLVQLQQNSTALKDIVDTDAVAGILGKKSDAINDTLREGISNICDGTVKAVSTNIAGIDYRYKTTSDAVVRTIKEVSETNKKLDGQIATLKDCLIIPSWKLLIYLSFMLCLGVYLGMVIR